jgi:hypothetical protein
MPGVFVSDGMSLRIPAGGLSIAIGDDGAPRASTVRFEVMLDVWPFWLDVALEHAASAMRARGRLEALAIASGTDTLEKRHASPLIRECKAGMVAISAAAFALDNFYSVVQRFCPGYADLRKEFERAGTARHQQISETLRRTFQVRSKEERRLRATIQEIFKYRDWAVHPPAEFRDPVRHDLFDVGVEWRFVAFRATNAVAVTRNATSLIDQCVNSPRKSNAPLVKWSDSHRKRSKTRWDRVQSKLGVQPDPTTQT